jgi:hypothetical protein
VAAKLWAEQNGRAEEKETQGCRGERDMHTKSNWHLFQKNGPMIYVLLKQ